jgi:hypothetical protein
MVNFTGLSQGIERGVRLGIALDENERRKADAASARKSREQNQILTKMQIDQLKDETSRKNMLRATNETLYHLASLKRNPQAYLKQLESDPESKSAIDESVNAVGQMVVDSRGIDDGLKREFAGFTPTPDGRLTVNLRVTRPDGTVYEPPLTEQGSADPDDPVMAFTVDDLGQLTSALNSEIQRLEGKAVGLGDTSPIARHEAGIARKQEIADKKDLMKYEYGLKGDLEAIKQKTKGGGGIGGGWKVDEAEKHIKSLVATGMGLNRDNFDSWDENQQKNYASTVDAVFRAWKANPEAGISGAYEKVIGSPKDDEFTKLPSGQQDALAAEYLKQNGVAPEGTGLFDFGEKGYSEAQLNLAKAKLSTQQRGIAESRTAANRPNNANYPPAPRDRAQREAGQIYTAPNGRLGEWTGTRWRLVESNQ